MSWLGFSIFCAASIAAFFSSTWACHRERRGSTALSGALLVALVASVWLHYHPTIEAKIFDPATYAHVRPWWSIVLGLAFLGSAVPQLAEKRKRIAVTGLSMILFFIVAERAAAAARSEPEEFTGVLSPEWNTCKQTTGYSCGAASAATLLAHVGVRVTEAEMAARCLTNPFSGTDEIGVLKGLGEMLAGTELEPQILSADVEQLEDIEMPAMACTKLSLLIGHWIVILDCENGLVTIADPLYADDLATGGIQQIPLKDFEAEYQGVLVRIKGRAESTP